MGLRGAGHRFMPNKLVFPGGAVDPGDATAAIAAPPRPEVLRLLERAAPPALAAALPVAAARELEEEAGLSLGQGPGQPPRLSGLDYLCRAVTPEAAPVRFDAHFFVADERETTGALAGSGELEDLRFYPVADALALDLAVATRGVLAKLLEWLAMSPEARAARAAAPTMRERVWQDV